MMPAADLVLSSLPAAQVVARESVVNIYFDRPAGLAKRSADGHADQPTIFFPTNSVAGCKDSSKVGGFNTWGFLAMLLAGYNAVNLVSSNINNRRNNNNNNNNDNNRNNNILNEANTDGDIDNMNPPIILPPVPGRRRRRRRGTATECAASEGDFGLALTLAETILAWLRVTSTASTEEESSCWERELCALHSSAATRGPGPEAVAWAANVAFAEALGEDAVNGRRGGLLRRFAEAARTGRRKNGRRCDAVYRSKCKL